MTRERAIIELFARNDIAARGLITIHGGADHAPADAESRLRQTRERRLQSLGAGELILCRNHAVREMQTGGDGGAHGELAVNIGGAVAFGSFLDQKSTNAL